MGLLDSLTGSEGSEQQGSQDPDRKRYAVLLNAGPERGITANNGLGYAIELDDAGHEVEIFLDGKATQWPNEFIENPDRPFNYRWNTIQSRGLLAGACGYCADALDQTESVERANVDLLSDSGSHAPSVAELADEGYELVTIG